MSTDPVVELIGPDEWQRLRSIRLEALTDSGHAFGGTFEAESAEDESAWRLNVMSTSRLPISEIGIRITKWC